MSISAIDFFKSNYYTSDSIACSPNNKAYSINRNALYILQQNNFYEVKPKLSTWKIVLSIALPLIPIIHLINSIVTFIRVKNLNDSILKYAKNGETEKAREDLYEQKRLTRNIPMSGKFHLDGYYEHVLPHYSSLASILR